MKLEIFLAPFSKSFSHSHLLSVSVIGDENSPWPELHRDHLDWILEFVWAVSKIL